MVQANPSLNLTVRTDQQEYYPGQPVQVSGNLTLDESPVTDGLVGLQINGPSEPFIFRTLRTGSLPPTAGYVLLEWVLPCDIDGNPQYTFQNGTTAYFKVHLVNMDPHNPRYVVVTFNVYYSNAGNLTPFGFASITTTIIPSGDITRTQPMQIPADAILGEAIVYANAYTNFPEEGGTPYYIEQNATFQITGAEGEGQTVQNPLTIMQSNETENYETTFILPEQVANGTYTVYVTSIYAYTSVSNSTTFQIGEVQQGVVGDLGGGVPPQFFAFDGKVDGKDLTLFLMCFKGNAPPEAMYLADLGGGVPPQFFQYDGVVDGKDLTLFLMCFKGLGP